MATEWGTRVAQVGTYNMAGIEKGRSMERKDVQRDGEKQTFNRHSYKSIQQANGLLKEGSRK